MLLKSSMYEPRLTFSWIFLVISQVTECEIFLSLLVKFLEPDKPQWQRALALEVLHTLTIQPALLRQVIVESSRFNP